MNAALSAMQWTGHSLRLLDQRRLPDTSEWVELRDAAQVAQAIRDMVVRGAPAIAAAASWGVVLEALRQQAAGQTPTVDSLEPALQLLEHARPTAVNLRWGVKRMRRAAQRASAQGQPLTEALISEAQRISDEDRSINRRIGSHGAALFTRPVRLLTHCNTGSLATVEYGTALGVIRRLHEEGRLLHVYVDETRPYLQGARLTAYELAVEQIPHTLITDSTAGVLMQRGLVDAVVVGADRIAANGDTANKIGTYTLAVLCRYHGVPFYVAAPLSSFDLTTSSGSNIPIEERDEREVTHVLGQRIAPKETRALHLAFDVTPHDLITAIITECGIIHRPNPQSVPSFVQAHAAREEAMP
ncbi:MAG: S-methyl-5-thioribose-1-phosphate isomerase [Thermoflavifilum sp.]|nr:S-methyl-5-thioribose-1-phosphate isomerase [Thermoflavifilum sp.]MCL6513928.1 S-methyl-5-thioribose-1-phosphate isomerase [Alicyclobacillus sp.]